MGKRAKNPAQLTQEEKIILDQVIAMTGAVFASIITKGPKDFAENLISNTKAKKRIATGYLLLNLRDIEVVTPIILNKELAKTMLYDDSNIKDPTDITNDGTSTAKNSAYINSTDMTEILHCFALGNICQNIIGKKEVKRLVKKSHRGKPKNSDDAQVKSPGRPSVYKITQEVEKLKALMSKPEACDRIRNAVVGPRLVHKYLKFLLRALYYVGRQDKSMADKLFRAFVPHLAKNPETKESFEQFWLLDEGKLDEVAEDVARISVDNYLRYDGFLFASGIFNIMSKAIRNFILL